MGLYSLAKRIEALNGLYGVKPRSDKQDGSVFWFMIPYQPDKDAASLYNDGNPEDYISSCVETNDEFVDNPFRLRKPHSQLDTFISNFLRGKLSELSITDIADIAESAISGSKPVPLARVTSHGDTDADNRNEDTYTLSTVSSESVRDSQHTFTKGIPVPSSPVSNGKEQLYSTRPEIPTLPIAPIGSPTLSPSISQSPNTEYPKTVNLQNQSDKVPITERKKELYSILLVDDAPTIIKLTSMLLRRHGHEVSTAENGEIAVSKLKEKWIESHGKKGFDFILMDLQMPVMDGLQATETIREIEKTNKSTKILPDAFTAQPHENSQRIYTPSHQLIIGMSANSDYDTMQAAFNAGIDDFMGKPFDLSLFNSITRKLKPPSPMTITTAL